MSINDVVLNKISNLAKRYDMLENGDSVLVALSGGADSVCLLHSLVKLEESLNIKVYAAHLNHMIRGSEADEDENFVRSFCKKQGVKLFVKKVNVPELASERGYTLEEGGREARYEFFSQLRDEKKIKKIATAHNKNDRAETVLMRILRGTGVDGISGIPKTRDGGIIRPLLDVSREEIEEYCLENELSYCTDSTNLDNEYTRNRIRNELIPYLKENFNPKVVDSVVRFSELASEDAEFLNAYAKRLYKRINNPMPKKKPCVLHIESLELIESSIKSRLIRIAAADALKTENLKLEQKHIRDIIALCGSESGTGIDISGNLRVENQYGWLVFLNRNEEKPAPAFENEFKIEVKPLESYFIKEINKDITFKLVNPRIYKKNPREIFLDFDKLEGKHLTVRNRRKGDRMICFPGGETKKLKSIFIDEKIPKSDRDKIPILCADGEIAAIIGGRVSEKYKITKETGRALAVEYGKYKSDD